jgi:hypothetical protein
VLFVGGTTTEGEQMKRFLAGAAMMGGVGLATGIAMKVVQMHFSGLWLPQGPEFQFAAGVGGLAGGAAAQWLFGKAGRRGWAFAGLGALLATLVGALVGGSLFAPGLGTLAGLSVFDALVRFPGILVVWLAMMAGVHVAMRLWFGTETVKF